MLKVPRTIREWRKHAANLLSVVTPTEFHPILQKVQSVAEVKHKEIYVLKFQNVKNEEEISVCIEPPLSMLSTIVTVMGLGGVNNEFGLSNLNIDTNLTTLISTSSDIETNKFRVLKQNETHFTFHCEKLTSMTVSCLVRMKKVHDDYLIVV